MILDKYLLSLVHEKISHSWLQSTSNLTVNKRLKATAITLWLLRVRLTQHHHPQNFNCGAIFTFGARQYQTKACAIVKLTHTEESMHFEYSYSICKSLHYSSTTQKSF